MRTLLALVAIVSLVAVAMPVSAESGPATGFHCAGSVCDLINRFCHCLGLAKTTTAPAPDVPMDCMGCDAIIAFCQKHFHTSCVESTGPQIPAADQDPAPEQRCAVSLCQDVDRICARWGAHCLA